MRNKSYPQDILGLFPIEAKIGKVAYKLRLPEVSRIHSTFLVFQLKKQIGLEINYLVWPPIDLDRALLK